MTSDEEKAKKERCKMSKFNLHKEAERASHVLATTFAKEIIYPINGDKFIQAMIRELKLFHDYGEGNLRLKVLDCVKKKYEVQDDGTNEYSFEKRK